MHDLINARTEFVIRYFLNFSLVYFPPIVPLSYAKFFVIRYRVLNGKMTKMAFIN